MGGAHRDAKAAIKSVGSALKAMLKEFDGKDAATVIAERRAKFLDIGSKGLAA
jgi:acetyl-CoA carboxylase carboxyl transferase subunit alpha